MNIDFGAVLLVCGGLLVGISLGSISTGTDAVANEVANKVTNTVTNMVTETEVYKVVCTSDGEGYCKEYSVRKINRE